MPYVKQKYTTLCSSCNKPITGESVTVKANKGHQKTWIFHASVMDCAYMGEVPELPRGAEGWIGIKSRCR